LLKVKFTAAKRLRMHLVMSGTRVERGKGLGGVQEQGEVSQWNQDCDSWGDLNGAVTEEERGR
jgi:hypothetical protein